MAITILPPPRALPPQLDSSDDEEDGGVPLDGFAGHDADGDISMRPMKRRRLQLVTPGETVTENEDAKWMRGHGTYHPPTTTTITSSLLGTLLTTNALLSVSPLHARYIPEIGDLLVGRIVEVLSKRWRVDISAPLLASLPLSAINLPGGILRKRTETDELQIRTFFAEGDLLVCEVQSLLGDGAASLHTRSLRFGKLRNGVFVRVGGGRAGAGVVRSRKQRWVLEGAGDVGGIEVILGVNGYVWIAKQTEVPGVVGGEQRGSGKITNMEEGLSEKVYSSQNEAISAEMRREIARVRGVIGALVESGVDVEGGMVVRGYEIAVGVADEMGSDYLGGENGKLVVERLLARTERKGGGAAEL